MCFRELVTPPDERVQPLISERGQSIPVSAVVVGLIRSARSVLFVLQNLRVPCLMSGNTAEKGPLSANRAI